MAQNWTDDCFAAAHDGQTDLQNIENNFQTLKSSFSGTSAPSNPVAGMLWLDTTNGQLKMRNLNNDGWEVVWDFGAQSQATDRHIRFTVMDPWSVYAIDTQVCLIPTLSNAIEITNLKVTCNANPATEIQGDIKYADSFIGFANATVINDFDTIDGARSDSSITSGSVAAGKCIYIQFDARPIEAITQISFDITYNYA